MQNYIKKGLNRVKEIIFLSFGIRAKKEELVLPPNLALVQEELSILKISFLMSRQKDLKKIIEKPSHPGYYPGPKKKLSMLLHPPQFIYIRWSYLIQRHSKGDWK